MMCIFHKWSKWEQFSVKVKYFNIFTMNYSEPSYENRQKRICEKCGKMQVKPISQD